MELLFGRGELSVPLPSEARAHLVRKPAIPVLPDPPGAVGRALEPLVPLARGSQTACVLICDITRPVPNGLLLPRIMEALEAAGVPMSGVTVLVATGLHRPNLGPELAELISQGSQVGYALPEGVRACNHYARREEEHTRLGITSRGTTVSLDSRFVDADLKLVTGLVEPHFMAGWSGGRKVISPGIASAETITSFHSAKFMEHPVRSSLSRIINPGQAARECNLAGNLLHLDQLEIVQMLDGPVLGLSVVLDEERRLCFCGFGDVQDSHAQAVDFVQQYAIVPVPRRYGTVVSSAAGYPLDQTYYQTIKAMVTALDAVRPGGTVIVAAEIGEGFGSDEFREAQRRLVQQGPEAFLQGLLGKEHAAVDEWQTEMLVRALRRCTVQLYSPKMLARPEDVADAGVVRCAEGWRGWVGGSGE